MTYVMPTYARADVSFVKGQGSYLTDANGKRYLDALAGIAVCGLGHAHPGVADAISHQAKTLTHTSNLYDIPNQTRLAQRLCELTGMDNVFFCNSGAEANEAAIKIARKFGNDQAIDEPEVIVMDGSFHGRTMATLSATGNRKVHAGFEPLVHGFVRAPYNDVGAIEVIAEQANDVVAVLVEPILGESGVIIPAADYLEKLRGVCDKHNWLLMLDEVQTGNGRTGEFFAFQHGDLSPDVVTTAKGLGNGVPIGACLARGQAADILVAGTHGSTFGGNPLACAAANAVLDELLDGGVIAAARATGALIKRKFEAALSGCNAVKEIRGKGMMIAIEVHDPCPNFVSDAMAAGVLLNVAADNVIRMLPPLNFSQDEVETLVDSVAELVRSL